jgi:hypothetical protein
MKLYDIRAALKNLVQINKELNEEKLTSLLQAAGWEEQDIKDAILLWKTNSFEDAPTTDHNVDLILKEDMHPSTETLDTTTTIFADTEISKVDSLIKQGEGDINQEIIETANTETKTQAPTPEVETQKDPITNVVASEDSLPPRESVFSHVSKMTTPEELPHNLPLRPYESSHVTVPLNEYQKRFASHVKSKIDTMHSPDTSAAPVATYTNNKPTIEQPITIVKQEVIRIEKIVEAPLETEDKYLVFIASSLFIVIIMILGYMQMSGRL